MKPISDSFFRNLRRECLTAPRSATQYLVDLCNMLESDVSTSLSVEDKYMQPHLDSARHSSIFLPNPLISSPFTLIKKYKIDWVTNIILWYTVVSILFFTLQCNLTIGGFAFLPSFENQQNKKSNLAVLTKVSVSWFVQLSIY